MIKTKTRLDIGNNLRPLPRVLIMGRFETNINTRKFNLMKMTGFQGSPKPMDLYLDKKPDFGMLPSQKIPYVSLHVDKSMFANIKCGINYR